MKIVFHPFFLWDNGYSVIWLSDSRQTVSNAIRHIGRVKERKCMQKRENEKCPSRAAISDKGSNPDT